MKTINTLFFLTNSNKITNMAHSEMSVSGLGNGTFQYKTFPDGSLATFQIIDTIA